MTMCLPVTRCLQAYAKLNLFLRVLARRCDGYHEIDTILQEIDLSDELNISIRHVNKASESGLYLHCVFPQLESNDNIIAKVYGMLKQECPHVNWHELSIDVRLHKRVPMGAGLGGGSSDAACFLIFLNDILQLELNESILYGLASQIGADVAFFIKGGCAVAGSIGATIQKQFEVPTLAFVLVYPNDVVSTKQAYAQFGLEKNHVYRQSMMLDSKKALLIQGIKLNSATQIGCSLWNDFFNREYYSCHDYVIDVQQDLILLGALGVSLSGSGSTMFGLFSNVEKATQVAFYLRKKYPKYQIFVSLSRSSNYMLSF